ncbi:MAG: peptide-methionine (S)-S-oxide reductase MsrA [Thermoplasmatota archaeon]
MEEVVFGAGCFWGVQASFDQLHGVKETEVGYSGGHTVDPTYHQVCSDTTGHAEVIRVVFDPGVISLEKLLDHFFSIHDPTTPNRQGPDIGSQYRSIIFFSSPEQERKAREVRDKWDRSEYLSRPIVTEIVPSKPFYRAEEYHQKYYEKNGHISCGIL